MNLVKCGRCGWVHFAMTLAEVEREVQQFNEFYATLGEEGRASYGNKPSSIARYKKCFLCGASHKLMVPAKEGDCPDGSTIQPVLGPVWN